MYTSYEQAIADIKGKFEGGTSFNIDWATLSKEAASNLRKRISPASIKRRVPIYGGVALDLPIFTSPTDVHTPADLYPATASFNERGYTHQAPQAYFQNQDLDAYTIDWINGIPFIYASLSCGQVTTILSVSDPDSLGGGVTMTSTLKNFISGSNGIKGTFTDAIYDFSWALTEATNYAEYQDGVAIVPFEAETDITDVEEVNLILLTDASNYFTISALIDPAGNEFTSGWNMARLDLSTRVSTGTPVISSIASMALEIKMQSGKTQIVTVDDITLHQTKAAFFEYYSNNNFRTEAGVWTAKPEEETDEILFTDEAYDVWFYEMCMLVVQDATYDSVDSKESVRLENTLEKNYTLYLQKFPSMQKPVSYNIASKV